eukprot:3500594-Pleurochrysis_carterae.AAC.1
MASGAGRMRGSLGESRMDARSRSVADSHASSLAMAGGVSKSNADEGQCLRRSGCGGARGM